MYIQFALYMVVEKIVCKGTWQLLLISSSHVLESWDPQKAEENLQLSYLLKTTVC